MVRILLIIFLLALLLVGLSFSSLNSNSVELNYYFSTIELPLAMVLVIAFAVGAIVGLVGSMGVIFKLKTESLRLKKNLKTSERELDLLRLSPDKK